MSSHTDPSRASQLPPAQSSKTQRVLACVLCQQRKVKCDRRFPCANCTKHQLQCVPATQARRRRRRFPERDLLDRLRAYEDLLRQNNVKFEPLHGDPSPVNLKESPGGDSDSDGERPEAISVDQSSAATPAKSESSYEPKNIWRAMTQRSHDPNDSDCAPEVVHEGSNRRAWDQLFDHDDNILLLGSKRDPVDLSTLHPEPVHIFRLWQIYLDNVNPLLKVTHTPSLQGRIIEAAGNVNNIDLNLEALMFSIYCMATFSLSDNDCETIFGRPKEDLMTKYHFGCQQALLNSSFLRTTDRHCLTALYLYLVSAKSDSDPRSLCSMLGIAVRTAQRMGMHNEAFNSKCNALEAEMRRRLWWSLVLFDSRIGELASHTSTILAPLWDCSIPHNVNDSDLREESKVPPKVQSKTTEGVYVVVRGEIGDFIRNSSCHLDFTNPALKPIAKVLPGGGDLAALENRIEEEYIRVCDPNNPLHFMTVWSARGYIARYRLFDHFSMISHSSESPTEAQLDASMSYAIRMLECDTKILSSPLTKGYIWLLQRNFPFPAYLHITGDLARRPFNKQAGRAWDAMYENQEARFSSEKVVENALFRNFAKMICQAWENVETGLNQSEKTFTPPKIVLSLRKKLEQMDLQVEGAATEQFDNFMNTSSGGFSAPPPPVVSFENQNQGYDMATDGGFIGTGPGMLPDAPGQMPFPVDMNQFNWFSMNWRFR